MKASLHYLFIVAFCLVFVTTVHGALSDLRPIIGVMTQPQLNDTNEDTNQSYMIASYAKWVEASGARVVPILYNSTQQQLDNLFDSINGLLYPGGADIINHTKYYDVSLYLFNRAIEANANGDYFPVWGTCLGLELMSEMVAGGDFSVLTFFDAENITLPLKFSSYAPSSRMFGSCPSDIYSSFATENMTANYHHYGLGIDTFNNNAFLNTFYKPLATSFDRENKEFVTAMEAYKFPFYATQFHPEVPLFYWKEYSAVDHSAAAIEAMQYLSRFFVNECRKSSHVFPDLQTELSALIDNYNTIFNGAESVYTFQ